MVAAAAALASGTVLLGNIEGLMAGWGGRQISAFQADLAYVHARAGRRAEAERFLKLAKTDPWEGFNIARAYVALGEPDSAFAWLDRSSWKWPHRAAWSTPRWIPSAPTRASHDYRRGWSKRWESGSEAGARGSHRTVNATPRHDLHPRRQIADDVELRRRRREHARVHQCLPVEPQRDARRAGHVGLELHLPGAGSDRTDTHAGKVEQRHVRTAVRVERDLDVAVEIGHQDRARRRGTGHRSARHVHRERLRTARAVLVGHGERRCCMHRWRDSSSCR